MNTLQLPPVAQMELDTLNAIRKLINNLGRQDIKDIAGVLSHNGALSEVQRELLQTTGCKIPQPCDENGHYMYKKFCDIFRDLIVYDKVGTPQGVQYVVGEYDYGQGLDQTYSSIKKLERTNPGAHEARSMLRTSTCAQPRALQDGDILVTGQRVIGRPRLECGGKCVLVLLAEKNEHEEKGKFFGTWVPFHRKVAIALERKKKVPQAIPPQKHRKRGRGTKK